MRTTSQPLRLIAVVKQGLKHCAIQRESGSGIFAICAEAAFLELDLGDVRGDFHPNASG